MKFRSAIFFLAVLVALLNWGCAKRTVPTQKPEVISSEELIARVKARSNFLRTYQAKLQIRGQSPKGAFRFQAVILSKLPDTFRLEAFTLWGQTAGVFVINKADAKLWIPSEKVVYSATHARDLLRHFLGMSIPMEILGYSLIASVPPDQFAALQMRQETFGWSASSAFNAAMPGVSWQFLANPPALKGINVGAKSAGYEIGYEPQVDLDLTSVPDKINFTSSQWQMEVKVSQVQMNPDLRPVVFNLQFPEGTRQVDLDSRK